MLEVVISYVIGTVLISITEALIISKLIDKKLILSLKNIVLLILMAGISIIQYQVNYSFTITIIIYIAIIFIYKEIFNMSFKKSVLVSGVALLLILLADLFLSIIIAMIMTTEHMRQSTSIFLLTNGIVCLIAYLIISNNRICNMLSKFVLKVDNSKIYTKSIFIIILILISSLLLLDLSAYFKADTQQYLATMTIIILVVVLTVIYMKSKNDNDNLIKKLDILYDYSQSYEDWISKEQLNNHEYKNQLAVLREYVKDNKQAKQYIDNIIGESFMSDDKWFDQLNNIPKGGIKGLLYYKLVIIEKNKLNLCVDISPKVRAKIEKINSNDIKDLSRVLGIIIDNAIEGAIKSKKKIISIEVYFNNDGINFVVSNTFSESINISKISKKGYSTKGKNRGNGLYFVEKIKAKNKNLTTETRIINNYFVQKIIIK